MLGFFLITFVRIIIIPPPLVANDMIITILQWTFHSVPRLISDVFHFGYLRCDLQKLFIELLLKNDCIRKSYLTTLVAKSNCRAENVLYMRYP